MAEKMNNLDGAEWLKNSFTIWRDISKTQDEKGLDHPAMFPQELPERLIKIYTREDGATILDPFVGIGSTLMAALKQNKKGIGMDLNNDYIETAQSRLDNRQQSLFKDKDEDYFEQQLINDNAKNLLDYIEPESVDLVITSPPYWDILNMDRTADNKDIRNYSSSKQDLGNIENYNEFLAELKEVYSKVYKTLKPDKRFVSVVMDIRKKDQFYPLHIDQTRIAEEAGFELEEFVIWDRSKEYNNMRPLGYPYVFRFNRIHEYICIYWKRD